MDGNQQNVNPAGAPMPQFQPEPGPQNKNRWVLIVVAVLVVIPVIWVAMSLTGNRKTTDNQQNTTAAGKLFDEMLAAAAAKTQVHLSYAQQDFASKSDFAAKKVQASLYSVAELDTGTKDYRAVYANQQGPETNAYYAVRRCLQGTMFKPARLAIDTKTVADVKNVLAQPFTATVTADKTEARDCSLTNPNHLGRVSDGIIPLGLSKTQIDSWLQRLKDSQFVTVEDQGMTTYNKQSVRKLHITTSSLAGTANFFTDAQKGAGLQLTDDKGAPGPDSYRFDEMATSDNIDGFYLINEQTKLPVYSQFTTASLLTDKGQPQPGKVLKQAYIYPEDATLSEKSTIDILE